MRRLAAYLKRHGLRATGRRLWLAGQRLGQGGMVLFFCDLSTHAAILDTMAGAKIERVNALGELDAADARLIESAWNPKTAQRRMRERFDRGASLWLCRLEQRLAGYGWTIPERPVEPYYFPLAPGDVHLFDFFVWPEFRGRRVNPFLVNHVLERLSVEKQKRAFIEAAEWNTPQLSSLSRTAFRPIGKAWKRSLFGKSVVLWL